MPNRCKLDQPGTYQIRVQGRIKETWSDWFDGLEIVPRGDQETLLTGAVADQAALYGILLKLHNLGLLLLSLRRTDCDRQLCQDRRTSREKQQK